MVSLSDRMDCTMRMSWIDRGMTVSLRELDTVLIIHLSSQYTRSHERSERDRLHRSNLNQRQDDPLSSSLVCGHQVMSLASHSLTVHGHLFVIHVHLLRRGSRHHDVVLLFLIHHVSLSLKEFRLVSLLLLLLQLPSVALLPTDFVLP